MLVLTVVSCDIDVDVELRLVCYEEGSQSVAVSSSVLVVKWMSWLVIRCNREKLEQYCSLLLRSVVALGPYVETVGPV